MSNYERGRKAEQRVTAKLRRSGASVSSSPGSKGAEDLKADFGRGRNWLVQVKSGENAPTKLTGTDLQRLNAKATKNNATPVLATVKDNKMEFRSTRSGRKLKP